MQVNAFKAFLAVAPIGVLLFAAPARACDQDSQCKGGRICVNSKCVEPAPTFSPNGSCARDADCPGKNDRCENNSCQAALVAPAASPSTPAPAASPPSTPAQAAPAAPGAAPRPRDPGAFASAQGALKWSGFASLGLNINSGTGSSETDFGFGVELHAAYGLSSDFSLVGIGGLGLTFFPIGELLPFNVDAAIEYEHAGPVKLLGGIGITYAPWLGAPADPFGNGNVPGSFFGVTFLVEAIYPLPGTRIGLLAKFSISPMNNSLMIIQFVAGAGMAF